MGITNSRPAGSRCWVHDTCDTCGRTICPDCPDIPETCHHQETP